MAQKSARKSAPKKGAKKASKAAPARGAKRSAAKSARKSARPAKSSKGKGGQSPKEQPMGVGFSGTMAPAAQVEADRQARGVQLQGDAGARHIPIAPRPR